MAMQIASASATSAGIDPPAELLTDGLSPLNERRPGPVSLTSAPPTPAAAAAAPRHRQPGPHHKGCRLIRVALRLSAPLKCSCRSNAEKSRRGTFTMKRGEEAGPVVAD